MMGGVAGGNQRPCVARCAEYVVGDEREGPDGGDHAQRPACTRFSVVDGTWFAGSALLASGAGTKGHSGKQQQTELNADSKPQLNTVPSAQVTRTSADKVAEAEADEYRD